MIKMQTIINNELKENSEMPFNKEKTAKKIMKLEAELFMPQHIPQGTPEDPDNPDYRVFTQVEKDKCSCSNCKFPFRYWVKKTDVELRRSLSSLEYLKANPV